MNEPGKCGKTIAACTNSLKELRRNCSPIGHNNTKHFLCPIRSRYPLEFLEIVRWESVPRGSFARTWKLSSRPFSRHEWLPLGLRGWSSLWALGNTALRNNLYSKRNKTNKIAALYFLIVEKRNKINLVIHKGVKVESHNTKYGPSKTKYYLRRRRSKPSVYSVYGLYKWFRRVRGAAATQAIPSKVNLFYVFSSQ